MQIYIVDDHISNQELCRVMLAGISSDIQTFSSGQSVLEALKNTQTYPDIIILDVMMPDMDGFITAEKIRKNYPQRHIPIIFLTVLDDKRSFDKCLSYGDDFIPKPVKSNILIAKVQAHVRIAKMYNEAIAQKLELSNFRDKINYEYSITESIFNNLMNEVACKFESVKEVEYVSTPLTVFNGDLIVLAHRPHGGIYAMIADATGHGLPAAISTLPAARIFFATAAQGLALGEMVTQINQTLSGFLPIGMMLAANVFEVSANGLDVSWWGGGLPDSYIIDGDGNVVRRLTSKHMPLGVLGSKEFDASTSPLVLQPGQKLVSCSDGVTEAINQYGERFGERRLIDVLQHSSGNTIHSLFNAVKAFSALERADDLSILTMDFPITTIGEYTNADEHDHLCSLPVHAKINFDHKNLVAPEILKDVRTFLGGIIAGGQHLDLVCSVVSELFANAIEHGLLGLDSKMKDHPDGFMEFYRLRQERLASLDDQIWLTLTLDYYPDSKTLQIEMAHSGGEFDYESWDKESDDTLSYGRGMMLLDELCDDVDYSDNGKCVRITYNLGHG